LFRFFRYCMCETLYPALYSTCLISNYLAGFPNKGVKKNVDREDYKKMSTCGFDSDTYDFSRLIVVVDGAGDQ
ncbi:MAG: hypothetical protein J2P41_20455, partial [Blastocatellia bacterium]|nr:hypothetical protein [Blastocatellia bacterium]